MPSYWLTCDRLRFAWPVTAVRRRRASGHASTLSRVPDGLEGPISSRRPHCPVDILRRLYLSHKSNLLDSREDAAEENVSRPAGLDVPHRQHGEAEDGPLGQTGRYAALGRHGVGGGIYAVQLSDDIVAVGAAQLHIGL